MPGVNFDAVGQQVSMKAAPRLLEFEPTSIRGDALRGPCPVHASSRPGRLSFSVNLQLGRYRCLKCGSQGNAFGTVGGVAGHRRLQGRVGVVRIVGD